MELLLTRKQSSTSEFSHLALIPSAYNLKFDELFVNDINSFKNCASSM
jgi:hypothetical protein